MPVITISRDSYSHGKEIAEKVAEKLGYSYIGPEIIQYVSESLDLPYPILQKALHNSPSFLEHIIVRKEKSLALFRSAFFEYMGQDNIVYHGLAGHVFLADVPNVIKVRILADFDDRITEKMQRENLNYEGAKKRLIKEDKKRERWEKSLYGIDNHDPSNYDLSLNLHNISIDKATAIIIGMAQVSMNGHRGLMMKRLNDMALEAKTEARLLDVFPEVEAVARDGEVFVSVRGSILQEEMIVERAKRIVSGIKGVKEVRIGILSSEFVPF
ncbi:AAA family ATPase [Thermodesulfobacteriota bacterium]